jgi:ABC-type glycerol-3-phosphate transport system permease component
MKPFLGFLIAPPVSVLLPVMLFAIGSHKQSGNENGELVLLFIPITIAYMSALFFGVPLYMLLKRLGWLRFWQVIAASVLCGAPFAIFDFLQTKMIYAPIELSIRWFGTVSIISALAGATFWIVALRRPNEL